MKADLHQQLQLKHSINKTQNTSYIFVDISTLSTLIIFCLHYCRNQEQLVFCIVYYFHASEDPVSITHSVQDE